MRCPTLAELPPPPPGKTGWPWTIESSQLPEMMSDGSRWPLISIVTPSYNQGQFIEETIRSVLLQGYPNLEYIVIDGGSTDDSVDVIRKYEMWLRYWVSEQDRGQSHAINKGYALASGSIFQWINSDDLLCPDALRHVSENRAEMHIVAGPVVNFGFGKGESEIKNKNLSWRVLITSSEEFEFQQPGIFLPMSLLRRLSARELVTEELQYIFDWHFIILCLGHHEGHVKYVDQPLARFRLHPASKTCAFQSRFAEEHGRVYAMVAEAAANDCLVALALSRHRRHVDQVEIAARANSRRHPRQIFVSLLLLAVSKPRVMIRRFYWGALRGVCKA